MTAEIKKPTEQQSTESAPAKGNSPTLKNPHLSPKRNRQRAAEMIEAADLLANGLAPVPELHKDADALMSCARNFLASHKGLIDSGKEE